VVQRHPGGWRCRSSTKLAAAAFWRRVAADLWGGAWVETEEPVPGKPGIPPDHWIRSTLTR